MASYVVLGNIPNWTFNCTLIRTQRTIWKITRFPLFLGLNEYIMNFLHKIIYLVQLKMVD